MRGQHSTPTFLKVVGSGATDTDPLGPAGLVEALLDGKARAVVTLASLPLTSLVLLGRRLEFGSDASWVAFLV